MRVFLSQSSRRIGEMIVFLSALRNIGNCEDVKLKYFSLWRDSSLCCASFRMTRFCFLLTIRNLNYFWNAKIFYYSYIFKGAKLAKFIRFEAGWKLYIFYHKVLGDVVKTMALLRALRNIGNCEDVKLKYFAFWRDSSLCCPSFRMTRFCFLLTIRILNYFWST